MDELDRLLQQVTAPWDERSWERLREMHPTAAGALAQGVALGLTEQRVRHFCATRGYPDWIGHWLAQAVTHLRRERDAEEGARAESVDLQPVEADEPGPAEMAVAAGRACVTTDPARLRPRVRLTES